MADRILRWYMDGNISRDKVEVGGTYLLEDDYVPEWVHITARLAGKGATPMVVDINDVAGEVVSHVLSSGLEAPAEDKDA